MKLFNEYLAESVKEYKFKVKLAMKAEPELMDVIERVLGKYDVKDITSPKTTPIQEHPMDYRIKKCNGVKRIPDFRTTLAPNK